MPTTALPPGAQRLATAYALCLQAESLQPLPSVVAVRERVGQAFAVCYPEMELRVVGKSLISPEPLHSHSSTHFAIPEPHASHLRQIAARIRREDLAADGIEDEPHITLLHGITGDDVAALNEALHGKAPIVVRLGPVSVFANDDADVVKIEVKSAGLRRLNRVLAEALPNTQNYEYNPHLTLGYVRSGLGKRYAGGHDLEGLTLRLDEVTHSGRQGEKTKIKLRRPGLLHAKSTLARVQAVRDWWKGGATCH